jgi:hypothetical protein
MVANPVATDAMNPEKVHEKSPRKRKRLRGLRV